MTRRLRRSEFILVYMTIITLACTVGGFFLGAAYMKGKIQEEQAAVLEAEKQQAEKERLLREQKLYSEQDFIRYYHKVYAPLLDLKEAHFRTLAALDKRPQSSRADALDQLADKAKETLDLLEKDLPLAGSPLLAQAKSQYQQSIEAYLDSIEHLQTDQNRNALTTDGITSRLTLFADTWLKAEGSFYKAVATWESAYVYKTSLPKQFPQTVLLTQWKQYPFHYRVYLAAEYAARMKLFEAFQPEDLTARLDMLLRTQEASTLGIKDIPSAIRLLHATGAVHRGDFKQLKPKLYTGLQVPELPLYKDSFQF